MCHSTVAHCVTTMGGCLSLSLSLCCLSLSLSLSLCHLCFDKDTVAVAVTRHTVTHCASGDAMRKRCVELLARGELVFEARIAAPSDEAPIAAKRGAPPYTAVSVAFLLLEAENRGKASDVVKAMPRLMADAHFQRQATDVLNMLRPLSN